MPQGVRGRPLIRGQPGSLLEPDLRLLGVPAVEAELAQKRRQPVRLVAQVRHADRPAQGTAHVVRDLVVRLPPTDPALPGTVETFGHLTTPAQVTGACLARLARVLQPLDAVLPDGLHGPVSRAVRTRRR